MKSAIHGTLPSTYPRRCLLMTAGRTPQVVTETLYALATRPPPETFVPTEVHLVTTEEGRRQAELELLDSGHGRLLELCTELHLDRVSLTFDHGTIHVVHDTAGKPLEDIRSVADNRASADAIVGLVRQLTSDADCALHVSLAGGRKTMGFYLGYALSLFGRPQDRLSHVLVDPRFEGLTDFFYPTRTSRILRGRDGRGTVDAMQGRVELADIPVVSLRGLLGPDLLGDEHASYADIVRRAGAQIDSPTCLEVDLPNQRIVANGTHIDMGQAERVWYGFFAWRCARGEPGVGWRNVDSSAAANQLRRFATRMAESPQGPDLDVCDAWISKDGQLDAAAMDTLTTRVNKQLSKALGPGPAAGYRITKQGRRGSSRYGIDLPPESIHLIEPDA